MKSEAIKFLNLTINGEQNRIVLFKNYDILYNQIIESGAKRGFILKIDGQEVNSDSSLFNVTKKNKNHFDAELIYKTSKMDKFIDNIISKRQKDLIKLIRDQIDIKLSSISEKIQKSGIKSYLKYLRKSKTNINPQKNNYKQFNENQKNEPKKIIINTKSVFDDDDDEDYKDNNNNNIKKPKMNENNFYNNNNFNDNENKFEDDTTFNFNINFDNPGYQNNNNKKTYTNNSIYD